MTLELGINLFMQVSTPLLGMRGGYWLGQAAYILGYETSDEDEGGFSWRQDGHITENVSVHEPRHQSQVLGTGPVHLTHYSPGDFAVDLFEKCLAPLHYLRRRCVVYICISFGGIIARGWIKEGFWRAGL